MDFMREWPVLAKTLGIIENRNGIWDSKFNLHRSRNLRRFYCKNLLGMEQQSIHNDLAVSVFQSDWLEPQHQLSIEFQCYNSLPKYLKIPEKSQKSHCSHCVSASCLAQRSSQPKSFFSCTCHWCLTPVETINNFSNLNRFITPQDMKIMRPGANEIQSNTKWHDHLIKDSELDMHVLSDKPIVKRKPL